MIYINNVGVPFFFFFFGWKSVTLILDWSSAIRHIHCQNIICIFKNILLFINWIFQIIRNQTKNKSWLSQWRFWQQINYSVFYNAKFDFFTFQKTTKVSMINNLKFKCMHKIIFIYTYSYIHEYINIFSYNI